MQSQPLSEEPPEVHTNAEHLPPTDAMNNVQDRVLSPVELCIQKGMDAMDKLCSLFGNDAMYQLTGYIEPLIKYGQRMQDCMDVIVFVETRPDEMELVTVVIEPKIKYGQPQQDGMDVLVETDEFHALVDPMVGQQLKNCTVRLEPINDVLSFVPNKDVCNVLLNRGRPHTHSQCTPKPPRTQRHPRKAHQEVDYRDTDTNSEWEPVHKKAQITYSGFWSLR